MHLIALGIKKRTGIPWVADFRDPCTNIDFYDKLQLTRYADRRYSSLERKILKQVDRIVTVSPSWQRDFEELSGRKIDLITNVYGQPAFTSVASVPGSTMMHVGSINADRNAALLWETL